MDLLFDVDDYDGRDSTDIITTSVPVLPPNLLLKCLQYLPVSSLPAVAQACRRLKVIVYSDELWESKLQAMGFGFRGGNKKTENNDDGGASLLDGPIDSLPRFPVHGSKISEMTRKRISANTSEAIEAVNAGRMSLSNLSEEGYRSSVEDDPATSSSSTKPRFQIPGLPGDPYSMIQGRKANQGAREQFKAIYNELWPYYVDFRQANKDSKVIQEFGSSVLDVARMLARLLAFSKAPLAADTDQINENLQGTCEYFENRCLHLFEVAYDSRDISEMAKFAGVLLDLNGAQACIQIFIQKNGIFFDNNYEAGENLKQYEMWLSQPVVVRENMAYPEFTPMRLFMEFTEMELQKQGIIISDVFPEEADVLYSFTERVFEDVISEYCSQLFELCSMRDKLLYLKSVPTAYRYLEHLETTVINMEPINVPHYRIEKLLARVFAPWLERYLKQELDWVQKSCKDQIDKYERQRDNRNSEPKRMNPRNREVFKRNFLKGFRNVITLPYKISSSIVAGVTAVSTSATSSPAPSITAPTATAVPISTSTTSASEASTAATTTPTKNKRFSIRSITSLSGSSSSSSTTTATTVTAASSAPVTPTTTSAPAFVPDRKSISLASDADSVRSAPGGVEVVTVQEVQEEMNSLLSVELALHLIHLDKDALQRLAAFAGLGGVLELVFIALLRSMGQQHIKPGFATAIQHLGRYKPSTTHNGGGVTPLMDFFELVHVADLILQMVQVYYAEEMCKHIDKMDFLNEANKEKKSFERMIDDGVAAGLDKSIEVMIDQVAYILATLQLPTDFNPEEGADVELQPTNACREAVTCLTTHTKMLIGCTDKHTLDVFFQELGLRLFNCLTKHLRSNIVSSQGGFVLICDLNHYYNFIVGLKQPTLNPNFLALKELGNLFIIQSPSDLKQLIHDMERFGGILRIEDVFEFAEMRSDWKSIQRIVERDRLECSIM
ncbi:F-box protein: endocytic membrane traffic, recycling ReCYcling 1 [Linnemannia exigua]|uniref:F-box protein: endocytic membrane traffic, recycling ReCYcling 1 n=1 Tax=Linnemannia exigua TaxID=604196 RepID=A0AAD4D2S9_9FUNG|nr:F-box protein: endocytic membrane traffic, recycling ReCYcling 1 [Linnemannia exigua]